MPATKEHTFCALICAPVPVGHQVELTWFETPGGGFLGPRAKQIAHVVDLDTQVVYAEMDCFDDIAGARVEVHPLPLRVRGDLTVATRVRGRVVSCQVATMGFTDKFIQTTLVVDTSDADDAD